MDIPCSNLRLRHFFCQHFGSQAQHVFGERLRVAFVNVDAVNLGNRSQAWACSADGEAGKPGYEPGLGSRAGRRVHNVRQGKPQLRRLLSELHGTSGIAHGAGGVGSARRNDVGPVTRRLQV